jgi:hypothetical protein
MFFEPTNRLPYDSAAKRGDLLFQTKRPVGDTMDEEVDLTTEGMCVPDIQAEMYIHVQTADLHNPKGIR